MKELILSNIKKYKDFEEFLKYENMNKQEFKDNELNGFIINITCGTYNGATKEFTPWRINDNNIIDTLIQTLSDLDYYNIIADMVDENTNNWSIDKFIYELVTIENIFIIENIKNIYINKN